MSDALISYVIVGGIFLLALTSLAIAIWYLAPWVSWFIRYVFYFLLYACQLTRDGWRRRNASGIGKAAPIALALSFGVIVGLLASSHGPMLHKGKPCGRSWIAMNKTCHKATP